MTSEQTPKDLKAILAKIACAETDDIAKLEAEIFPEMVDLSEAEVDKVFQQLKVMTKISMAALRKDWTAYLSANGLGAKTRETSAATALIDFVLEDGGELWRDPGQNAWLTFRAGDHREHHPLKSRAAKRYFAGLYFRKVDRAPPGQALQDAIQTLEAKAIFEGAQHTPFVRIAADADSTYLDLVNELWEVVQLKASGWKVIPADEAPVRFRRSKAMSSLPKPTHGGDITALRSLLNLGDDDAWVLTCAYLLGCFQPKGPYPVLGLSGEQGSGKSTAARLLRDCIDPNISPLRALPKSERDLLVAATHSWLLAFDNLSGLADWMSDALCRLSTGGGLSTRELYSDGEEFLLDATRPTILNGIADIILRNDLADRAIVLHLPTITEKARLSEREIDAQFAANHAGILGALLSAVAYGMKALPDTQLGRRPRLADFALWVTACEPALGFESGTFMAAYGQANADLVHDLVETNVVGQAILRFIGAHHDWVGTASELLTTLSEFNGGTDKCPKNWPKSPESMVGALKRLAPALRAHGVQVEQLPRDTNKKRTRRWLLKMEKPPAEPSEPSEQSDEQDVKPEAPPNGACNKCGVPLCPEEKAARFCIDCQFFAQEETAADDMQQPDLSTSQ